MAGKFNCPKCGNEIVSDFLKGGEKTNCPRCGETVFVTEDAVETVDKMNQPPKRVSSINSKKLNILITSAKYAVGFLLLYFFYSFIIYFVPIDMPDWIEVVLYRLWLIAINLAIVILVFILAEGVKLFLAIEKNTRETCELLKKYLEKEPKEE